MLYRKYNKAMIKTKFKTRFCNDCNTAFNGQGYTLSCFRFQRICTEIFNRASSYLNSELMNQFS